jgi:hypothetical protein
MEDERRVATYRVLWDIEHASFDIKWDESLPSLHVGEHDQDKLDVLRTRIEFVEHFRADVAL